MRDNIIKNIYTYKKGVSLLLRDSLEVPSEKDTSFESPNVLSSVFEKHICITDHKSTVREKVGTNIFEFPADLSSRTITQPSSH